MYRIRTSRIGMGITCKMIRMTYIKKHIILGIKDILVKRGSPRCVIG